MRFDPPDAGKCQHVGNLYWGLSLSCLPHAQAPRTTCARRPGSGGVRQRPLFRLLFSLWMSLNSLACLSRVTSPDLAPWVPRSEKRQCCPSSPTPEVKRRMLTPRCPRPHLISAFEAQSLSSLLQAASVWGPGHPGPLPSAFLGLCCCGNSRSTLATRPPEQLPEGRRPQKVLLGLGLWPYSLLPSSMPPAFVTATCFPQASLSA